MTRLQSQELAAPQQASSISEQPQGSLMEFASAIDYALNQTPQQSTGYTPPPGLNAPDIAPWGDEKAAEVFHSTPDASMASEALRQSSQPLTLFMDSVDEMWQNASPDAKADSFMKLMNSRAKQVSAQTGRDAAKRQVFADELEAEALKTYPGLKVPKEEFVKLIGMHEDATTLVDQWANQQHFDSIYSDSKELANKYKDKEDRAQFFDIVRSTTKSKIGGQADGLAGEAISNIGAGGSDVAGNMVRFLNSYMPGISRRDERADELEFMNNLKQAGRAGAFEPPADRGFVRTGIMEAFKQLPAMAISTAGVGGGGPALASGGRLAAGARAAGQAYKTGGTIGAVRAGLAGARAAGPEVAAELATATKAAEAATQAAPGVLQAGKAAWAAAPSTGKAIGSSLGAAAKAAIGKAPVEALRQTAFWTTQIAPSIEQDLVESGVSRDVARPAALITGAIEGALENLNARQLYGPAIKKWGQGGMKRYLWEVSKQYFKEWGEEFNQAGTEMLGEAAAHYVDGKDYDWTAGWKKVQDQTAQSAIPVGVMQVPGAAMGARRQYQGAQQRQGDLFGAEALRAMDPAARKAIKEGGEEVRRIASGQAKGENVFPLGEDSIAKLHDLGTARAPAEMHEALQGRRRGEGVVAYQDRMKTIQDTYRVDDSDARVGSVKRYYDEASKALQDMMRAKTASWTQSAPLDAEDEQEIAAATPTQDSQPAEPDKYGWQPIQKDPAVEHAKLRAAMSEILQEESGKKMTRKQRHAEAVRRVARGDEAEQAAAVKMYQDPRAAALFYLFGIEDNENPSQSRPDAGRHLAVADRHENATTFEEHGLPGLSGLKPKDLGLGVDENGRGIGPTYLRKKFVDAIRKFSELPRGLVKEIARLATSDTEALTEDAGGNVKIDRTWRKYPAGSNAKGMIFHDTPFGRFGRRIIPGDVELTPFSYEEAGNWVASIRSSQNAPESTQAPQAPTAGSESAPQGEATPIAQQQDQEAPAVEATSVAPELQAEMDKALQEGDLDKVMELMERAQSQNETTSKPVPVETKPAPSETKAAKDETKPTAPPVKPAAKKTDRIAELEAQVKELGRQTKAASDAGDTETAQRLAAEAGKLIDEIGTLEKAKPKADTEKKPEAPKGKSALEDLDDLMQSPKDWQDAATQIAAGATSLATEVTLPKLYETLQARFKGLTHEEFRRGMRELHDQKKLVLGDYTRAADDVASNPAAILFPAGDEGIYDQWKFYVRAVPQAPEKITAKSPGPRPKPRTAQDEIYDALPAPVQRVVDEVRKLANEKYKAFFTLVEEPEAGWTTLAMDLAERVSGKTGAARTMPVVWFRGNMPSNGMTLRGVVFLNADLPRPDQLWDVIAHEVAHILGIDESLKLDDDDLLDQIKQDYYNAAPAGLQAILRENKALWNKEAIAHLIGRLFRNPDFRRQMQYEKPTLWAKIVAAFRRFFERFRAAKQWDPKDPARSLAQKHMDKIQEVFMGTVPTKVTALTTVPAVAPSKFPELDDLMFSPMKDVAQYLRDRYKSTANEEKFFSRYMQDALRALQVQVTARTRKGNISKAGIRKAVDKYMEDVSSYLDANPNLAEYYANEAHRERTELVKVFPELEHDEVWAAYRMLNGMASAQTNLGGNVAETIDAWALLREKGEIPTKKVTGEDGKPKLVGDGFVVHGGPSSRNKINNYRAFNKLLKKHGSVGEVAAFLTGSVSRDGLLELRKQLGWATIGEIGPILDTVKHATGQTESIPRMFVFGPKVGAYILNRMGDSRYQTIDVWESRLARFYLSDIRFKPGQTGLLEGDDRKIAQEFGKLVAEELGLDPAAAQAVRWYHFKGFVKDLGYGKVKDEDLKTLSEITAARLAIREGDGGEDSGAAAGRTHAVIRGSGRGVEARRRAAAEEIRTNTGGEQRESELTDDELMFSPKEAETPAERVEKQRKFNKAVAKYIMEQKRYATYPQFIRELVAATRLDRVLQYEPYIKTAWNTARALMPQMQLQAAESVGDIFPSTILMLGEPTSDLSKIYSQAKYSNTLFIAMDNDNEQIDSLSSAAIRTIQEALRQGGSVHVDLGSWKDFASAQGKGWVRVVQGVGKILAGLDKGQASRINVIMPDVFGNQTESHQLQKVVAGHLRPLADAGITFIVPIQKGDESIAGYVGWTTDGLNLPPTSIAIGLPVGGRQWSQEQVIRFASDEADNKAMNTRIHLMGISNKDAGSLAAYIKGVNDKAVVTAENSQRHRGEDHDHLEGIGRAFSYEMRKARLKLKKEGDTWLLTDTNEGDYESSQGTYNNQNWIKNIGGVWDQSRRGYKFQKDPRQDIYNNLTRRKRELEEKKRQEEARADLSILSKPANEIVSKETRDAINAGSKAGVTEDTLKGQIEDIARISEAISNDRRAFILAAGTGTGKTFVLGGVVREALEKFPKVIWVTKNKELVAQAKKDTKVFGIEDGKIEFMTYAALSTSGAADARGALLIFDESHEINNFVPDENGVDRRQTRSERAVVAQEMIKAAQFTVFSSATPMRNPVDAGYIASTGLFGRVGGFVEWAQIYGADVAKTSDNTLTVHWAKGGRDALHRTAEARRWLLRQGVFSKQKVSLPKGLVHTIFRTVSLDSDRLKRFNDVMAAYQKAMADNTHAISQIKRHSENVYKRLTEFLKAPEAIKEAQRIVEAKGQVVVFTDYKAESWIGRYQYSERYRTEHGIKDKDSEMFKADIVVAKMDAWRAAAAEAKKNGGTIPTAPFADEIYAIAKACRDMGLEFKMDSTLDLFSDAFNKDEIGYFTGPYKGDKVEVTAKSRVSDKEKWLAGKKKVLVATIGSGGTGLSLHDTTGKMPTRMQLGIALPWTGVATEQAAGRLARQGIKKETGIVWMFAEGITFEKTLAARVGARLNDMGGLLSGIENPQGSALEDFDFEGNFDPMTGGVARELQIEAGARAQENDYGFVQGQDSEEGGSEESEEVAQDDPQGQEDAEGDDVEYAEGVDEGVTEKDGFKVGDLVEYADPGEPSSAWVGSVTAFKGDSAWVATEDEEYLIPLSWMDHLEKVPSVDDIPVDKPTPPPKPKAEKQADLFEVERPSTSRIFSIDPQKVSVAPGMQFKKGADKEGVTEGDKIGEQESWDETMAGTFLFWQDNDGKVFVADGHHRLAHAKKKGADLIHGYLLREQDGYTFQAARAHAAMINIKNDKGTVYDHAAFFRDSEITEEEASDQGLFRKVMGRTGLLVGRFASDSVYEAFLNEDITPEKAAVIAEIGKDNLPIQAVGLKWAKTKRQTAEVLRESLRIFRDSRVVSDKVLQAKDEKKQKILFGDEWVPSADELEAEREADAVAAVVVKVKADLRDTMRRHKNLLRDPDKARKEDVSFNLQTSQSLIEKSEIELDEWERVSTNHDLYERARLMAGLQSRATDNLGQEVANSYGGSGGRRRGSPYKGAGAAPANQPSTSFPFTPSQVMHPMPLGALYDLVVEILGSPPEAKKLRSALGMAIHKEMLGVEHMRILIDKSAAMDPDLVRKVLAHEIGHIDDVIDPNSSTLNTIKRGNLIGRIRKLRKFLGGQFGGTKNSDLRKELLSLTEWWSGPIAGSASYVRYRKSSKELFAEFLSVFLVSPGEAQARAPIFYAEFLDALNQDLHQPFKQDLIAIQALLAGSSTPEADRMARVLPTMWSNAEDTYLAHRKMLAESMYRPAAKIGVSFLAVLLDKNAHGKKMAKEMVKGKALTAYEAGEYLATLDDLHHANSPGLVDLGRFLQSVTMELEAANINRTAFDNYMFAKRVEGDTSRSGKLNPLAVDERAAAEYLQKLPGELGPVKWAKLEQIGRNASDIMFAAFERGYDEGLFTDEMMDQARLNRYTYMPFVIMQYYNGWVHPGVKPVEGTLLETSPATEAITKKLLSLNRAIVLNKAKRETMRLGEQAFSYHARKLKTDNLGNLLPSEKLNGDLYAVLKVMEGGKEVQYEADKFLVDMFETHNISDLNAVVRFIGNPIYTIWHPLFVAFNPKFLWRNLVRDPMRTIIGLPSFVNKARKDKMAHLMAGGMNKQAAQAATKDMKVGSIELLFKYYWPAFVKTWAARRSKDVDFMRYYMEKGVFSEQLFTMPSHKVDLTPVSMEVDRMYQEAGYRDVPDSAVVGWRKQIAPLLRASRITGAPQMLSLVNHVNQVIELTSKVASTDAMVDAGLDPSQVKLGARKHSGTPDIQQRGYMTGPANALSMYFKVKFVGLASDASLAFNPSTAFGWWMRTAVLAIAPAFANAALRMLIPGYKDAEDRIPEYIRKNYLCLFWPGMKINDPARKDDPEAWKTPFISIPMDETTRFVHAVTTNLFDTMWRNGQDPKKSTLWQMLKDDFGATVDQLVPSYNPAITIAGGWMDYMSDTQPIDKFYGSPIIPDRQWDLRDEDPWPTVQKMVAWTVKQFGVLDVAYQAAGSPFTNQYYEEDPAPWYHSAWKITGLDALFRSSDQGLDENLYKEQALQNLEGVKFRARLNPSTRKLSSEFETLRDKKDSEMTGSDKKRKESLRAWMNGTYTPIRQAIQNAKEIGLTDAEVKDLYASLNATAGELRVLDVDTARDLRQKVRIAKIDDDLSEPATIRDIGGKAASLLETKMYLTKKEADEAQKMGIAPEEMFRRIQAQMYSDRVVTKEWLKARGITPQQALEAYQFYAHERAANSRSKDGKPGKVDPASLRRSVGRLITELSR